MKRMLLRILFLLGGLIAGLIGGLLMPADVRLGLSRNLAVGIGRMVEHCPEG